jgi:hypothetical protein
VYGKPLQDFEMPVVDGIETIIDSATSRSISVEVHNHIKVSVRGGVVHRCGGTSFATVFIEPRHNVEMVIPSSLIHCLP